ncbi:CRISPR-associated endoribonuclease Cas2 [Tepiditoga spiralis]|uniref:CRISPR-associated endoribonuclease Cas2 n=1 Tax=Tepiditoga spiralis TaxID=2108365 RepID=A0A7G1G2P3_9BACT|nr:CRISPR-associated endonuclease Cas2 [Tepiditoga spiralis]BBE30578.1 CRISPR-associated endoribonuclease Cas2 [Tepiditoga spiralis]
MYIVLMYDINTKRVGKVHKIIKQYLNWIQNSVFEGSITEKKFNELKRKLKIIIKENEDSIIYFETLTKKNLTFDITGIEKNKYEKFL